MITAFIKIKNVYGRELVYPACSVTEIIAGIAKTKTLSKNELDAIKKLGYNLVVVG